MDWFLYDRDLRHERVKDGLWLHTFMTFTKNGQYVTPLHPQKGTIDLLFESNRIRKHLANFNNPSPYPSAVWTS